MLCHGNGAPPSDNNSPNSLVTTKRGLAGGALAAVIATATLPHALCLVGLGGVISAAGWGIHKACSSSPDLTLDPNDSYGVTLPRLNEVPLGCKEIDTAATREAASLLLDHQPGFIDIIKARTAEPGSPVEAVFLKKEAETDSGLKTEKDDSGYYVVVCVAGKFCPCEVKQLYFLGRFEHSGPETWEGQAAVLNALKKRREVIAN